MFLLPGWLRTISKAVGVIARRNPLNWLIKIIFLILFYLVTSVNSYSQSIGILAGHFALPADYFSLRYSHYSNLPINGAIGIFRESSHTGGLNYSSYGLDVLGEYTSTQGSYDQKVFGFKAGVGASWQIENEAWVYQGLSRSQSMNYGLVGELTGEWNMTENFSLSVFGQQKFLFNKSLGSTRFSFGIGLKFNLTNF
jgi:hypothetical protein